jgi:putative ABC transport system permease protein
MRLAARIARRELRGGLRGFRIFLACLALGVAAIAGVGSVRVAIESGLAIEGAVILGGDAEMSFSLRTANTEERAWMAANAVAVSETLDFRSMAVTEREGEAVRGLTQVRAVDGLYPLYGDVGLSPAMTMAEALATNTLPNALPGAVMHPVLIGQMGLTIGDTFTLGTQAFELRAALEREPDMAGGNFGPGPRTIVTVAALENSGLLTPGTLFDSQYRLQLPPGADLAALQSEAIALFGDNGHGWRDRRNAAPALSAFVDRIGAFLVLVGLAGMAVGGIGISAAVRSYLDGKTETIATLKTLGASGGMIFTIYLMQIALLTLLGLALGLILGAALPLAFAPMIEARLPVPANFGLHPAPLMEAALYGALTALIFALWPLARTEQVRAATLFRQAQLGLIGWPRWPYILVSAALAAALIAAAAWLSGLPYLALWSAGGIIMALLVLMVVAWLLRITARRLAKSDLVRGRSALRLAFGAVGGPASDSTSVVLSLGLGLSVLAAVGQIDSNLRAAIQRDLPEVAPSYFFIDIQQDQLPGFLARVTGDPAVSRVETAPILRGFVTRINGRPAREVAGDHWVTHGDRGITYLEDSPPPEEIVAGEWWVPGYDGPPLMAFAADEAREIGIGIGDTITVNILGRDITATIAALREVDFSNAGIGFVITMSSNSLAGAPHTNIATVYADARAEAAILRDVARDAPNITAIRVRDVVDQVARALAGIAAATSWGAAATLATGFMVLIGAAAAGERARTYEAAVLKTLGATRGRILLSFALRAGMQGAAAGLVAVGAGALAGWAVMRFVMETDYTFNATSALVIVIGGAAAALLAGLGFSWRPLAARPARILRARD